ncbi:MAG TPA: toll/interleukin-1 receptor domain-containing protein, partial [Candidatus Methanoperedenaceae archaeon]|nr:toll/interleukin-1 receptor domain-containing protein [Candidatus Methanoperedenaceae archaeon]
MIFEANPMDSNVTHIKIKSLRIFLSYSTNDKVIAGSLKTLLELMGFEVFLAHEDIEPSVEWQEEIKDNLDKCDIFIPLLT